MLYFALFYQFLFWEISNTNYFRVYICIFVLLFVDFWSKDCILRKWIWQGSVSFSGNDYWKKDYCYQGTLVIQGTGIIRVDKIGNETEYGKIGYNIDINYTSVNS